MTNPLIDKYFELYPEKKEKPKKVEYELPPEWNTKGITTPSVATSNTGITAVNPPRTFTSYDRSSGEDSFLQIADKIKKGDALVVRQEINMENFTRSITFEVQVFT